MDAGSRKQTNLEMQPVNIKARPARSRTDGKPDGEATASATAKGTNLRQRRPKNARARRKQNSNIGGNKIQITEETKFKVWLLITMTRASTPDIRWQSRRRQQERGNIIVSHWHMSGGSSMPTNALRMSNLSLVEQRKEKSSSHRATIREKGRLQTNAFP